MGYAILYKHLIHSLLSVHHFSNSAGWLCLHAYNHRRFEQLIDPAAPKIERALAPDIEHAQEASRTGGLTLDAAARSEAANSNRALRGPNRVPASYLPRLVGRLTTQATDWF